MTAIICSFLSGIDDMPRKHQADAVAVLRVLQACGRYSVFEAMANNTIARTMSRLHHKGFSVVRDGKRTDYGKLIEKTGGEYPWTNVRLTEGGERLLADSAPQTPESQP